MIRSVLLISVALSLVACESLGSRKVAAPIDIISLQYDPYNYSMAELTRNANAACAAKGGNEAIPVNNELNTESVRWAYMNFECY